MAAVVSTNTGVLFQHPATNTALVWNHTTRVLTFTNAATAALNPYYDVSMYRTADITDGVSSVLGFADDMPGNGGSVSLTNNTAAVGWHVTALREDQSGPGFTFNGSGWADGISGLATYWY